MRDRKPVSAKCFLFFFVCEFALAILFRVPSIIMNIHIFQSLCGTEDTKGGGAMAELHNLMVRIFHRFR